MKYYSNVEVQELPHRNHLYTLNTESFSIDVDPIDRKQYQATAEVAALGALTIARIDTNAAVVSRKNEVAPDPDHKRFSIMFAVTGELVISHHLGMTTLKGGEFTLLDNSYPRTMFVYHHVSLLLISVPRVVLQRYLPLPEEMEARTLSAICVAQANNPGNGLDDEEPLFESLLALWDHLKKGSLREFAPTISDNLLSNVALVYSRACREHYGRPARRISQAKQLIEDQLTNPEFSVEALAAAMGLSSRYLRGLFHGSEKVSHYILRRRLEESANQLANALHQNVSITAIAFRCGFNSTAHFSRAFRKHFNMTPREYRSTRLLAADS